MGIPLVSLFTNDARHMKILKGELKTGFFFGFSNSTAVRAFAWISLEFTPGRTETAFVRLVIPLDQQHTIFLIKGVEQSGDAIRERHSGEWNNEQMDFLEISGKINDFSVKKNVVLMLIIIIWLYGELN